MMLIGGSYPTQGWENGKAQAKANRYPRASQLFLARIHNSIKNLFTLQPLIDYGAHTLSINITHLPHQLHDPVVVFRVVSTA